jgi:hypothetical protein
MMELHEAISQKILIFMPSFVPFWRKAVEVYGGFVKKEVLETDLLN